MKPTFERGAVVFIPKAKAKRYHQRPLHTPGIVRDIFYSKKSEGFIYEIEFMASPEIEYIRETDLVARDPRP